MAAILRSGKFLRLFSGVARNLAATGGKNDDTSLAPQHGLSFDRSFSQANFSIQNVLPYLGVSDSGHAEDRSVWCHTVTASVTRCDCVTFQVPHPPAGHPQQVPGPGEQGGDRADDLRDRSDRARPQDRHPQPAVVPGPAGHQVRSRALTVPRLVWSVL